MAVVVVVLTVLEEGAELEATDSVKVLLSLTGVGYGEAEMVVDGTVAVVVATKLVVVLGETTGTGVPIERLLDPLKE